MNKNANPLEYIIWCAENNFRPSSFDINNAKDELKKLQIRPDTFGVVAWARKNDRGDLYDIRVVQNPYLDPSIVVPLYSDGKTLHDNSTK